MGLPVRDGVGLSTRKGRCSTAMNERAGEPEEGDSRYLSHELLLPHDKLVQMFSGTVGTQRTSLPSLWPHMHASAHACASERTRHQQRPWERMPLPAAAPVRTSPATSDPHRDWARPCHICTGTGPAPATSAQGPGPRLPHSAPGPGPPFSHRDRDRARPPTSAPGPGLILLPMYLPVHACGTGHRAPRCRGLWRGMWRMHG